ncbi:low molecular weight phosphotyrosine protein phosphatase [Luteipulveratus sp. YIM 133132]|uniref:protein-tyrosine-phosphatase n=1 Tax=Luteipulveratus flavus TaxID=3031728 RepID=A0ABT6CBA3_9MICO|nr:MULTISPECIES: low molecular weight protein-tyrosine-phosphatase [unclassified Luteipulveratus]MDE9365434.1 low molecular weight phosphotyrosine protein phosphatase [Luteipulveratus sp. YIM 133132]MDF8266178.1 low molecular weight phosphotyrosine protein phosphatase [Luteipulveratus sp. YIM 133296]
MTADPYRVCVVCSGNICRSPMGEIVLRDLLADAGLGDRVVVDSAGTGDWHVGDPADRRTVRALHEAGYDGAAHRAQHLTPPVLAERDLVLVADRGHLREVERMARHTDTDAEIRLLREFDPAAVAADQLEVDDPYFGDEADFRRCLEEVAAACAGVVDHLRAEV